MQTDTHTQTWIRRQTHTGASFPPRVSLSLLELDELVHLKLTVCVFVCFSHSVVSNSLQLHGL